MHGLKVVTVAVVAQADWDMDRSLFPNREWPKHAAVAVTLTVVVPGPVGQVAAIDSQETEQ